MADLRGMVGACGRALREFLAGMRKSPAVLLVLLALCLPVSSSELLPGDLNNDGVVNDRDLLLMQAEWHEQVYGYRIIFSVTPTAAGEISVYLSDTDQIIDNPREIILPVDPFFPLPLPVTLPVFAAAHAGYRFDHWAGIVTEPTSANSLVIAFSDQLVTAVFAPQAPEREEGDTTGLEALASTPALTGTFGNTSFPIGGGPASFYITGENLNPTNPNPVINIGSNGGPAPGYDPGKSNASKLAVVSMPPAPGNTGGDYKLYVSTFPAGGGAPTLLTNPRALVTYQATAPTWQSLGQVQGAPGDRVHLNGTNFNPQATYTVKFGVTSAQLASGTDPPPVSTTGIWVIVPPGRGSVSVTIYDSKSQLVAFDGMSGRDLFSYRADNPTWQSLSKTVGAASDVLHINGLDFNPALAYTVQFATASAQLLSGSDPPAISDTGIWVRVPEGTGKVQVTVKDHLSQLVAFTGKTGQNMFAYSNTCGLLSPASPIAAGAGYIQTRRWANEAAPLPGVATDFAKVDVVNPMLVNATAVAVSAALPQPYRYKSWAGGMLWADNQTEWYNPYGPVKAVARQVPIYADPLIVCYTDDAGNNYFQQSAAPNPNDNAFSVYGKGFHLSMPNPNMDGAATYNSGTGDNSYNQNATIWNGANHAIQVGLSMLGEWRDTLVVYPASAVLDPTAEPLFLPPTALVHRQGDFDIEFVMPGPGFDAHDPAAGQYLKLAVTQGSPFAQFTAHGAPGVVMAGVFPEDAANPSGAASGLSAIYQLTGLQGGSGSLNYVILHQQVNWMYAGATSDQRKHTNWVSFALAWDPATAVYTFSSSNGKTYCHLAFDNPAALNRFVVIALPSQLANSNTAADTYAPTLARHWVEQLAGYAFNYVIDTSIEYSVGQVQANQVDITYAPSLLAAGPVAGTSTTVFLLQPHHYSQRFADGRGGVSPLVGSPAFLAATGDQWSDAARTKYWVARGKLEAITAEHFSLSYAYPGVLPALPMMPTGATRQGLRPATQGQTYQLRDMASAMVAIEHYLGEIQGANSPATTSMDGHVAQDTYNVGKSFLRAARMLHMLLPLVNDPAPPDIYHVGQPGSGLPAYTPHTALALFTGNLAKAFQYYFGQVPQCIPGNTDSYYYAYYEPASHHLMLYPAASAAGAWPTNLIAGEAIPYVWDGYGTVTMLNDHHYTYGYHILSAALLALALQNPAMPAEVKSASALVDWWQPERWGTVVDQLIMDVACDDRVSQWYTAPGLTYPQMEYFDEWTGIPWTDGFMANATRGHNDNSPWESLQVWAGIILWGEATGRPQIRDLGIYLYTVGLYSLEAYRYNTTQTMVPVAAGGDWGAEDTFLFKSTMNIPARSSGVLPHFDEQNSNGQVMWQRQMSDAAPGRGTSRITYVFQGGMRSDNTYNQTPLGQQFTSTYPHAPWSLAMTRSQDYMNTWAQAILFQNSQSHFEAAYSTNTNLLYAALGLSLTADWYQGTVPTPLPPDPAQPANYSPEAFHFMQVGTGVDWSPYLWYWKMCAWSNVAGKPIWQDWSNSGATEPADKINLYISADMSIAEPLLHFYAYDTYGQPDLTLYATSGVALHPLATAFNKGGHYTFVAYNAQNTPVTVQFKHASGAAVGAPSPPIAPHTLAVW